MKVVLSAMACHPTWGSEAKFGWDAAQAIAEFAECHVVTHTDCQSGTEKFGHGKVGANLHFHYLGKTHTCHPNRLVARLQSWVIFANWQKKIYPFTARLHQRHKFDVVHHITYASWRIPSPLWKLHAPFIWGPVGGASTTPASFYPVLSNSSRSFENLRRASNLITSLSPAFKACVRNAALVLAAEDKTAHYLREHRSKNDVRVLCPAFFSQQEIEHFRSDSRTAAKQAPLRIFGGGNLEGRKGVALALHAIARLKVKGIDSIYTLGGSGPERIYLKQLATRLGISRSVVFGEGFSGDEYRKKLGETEIYLLPSLRETAGITMMEAMLAGCYAIVLAGTGAGDIVQNTGGAALDAEDPEEAISKIAAQLEWCNFHREQMIKQAEEAAERVRVLYSKEAYQKAIKEIYAEAIARHRQGR
jgi:glycosyltransferase involved in cell wall biosynthesis